MLSVNHCGGYGISSVLHLPYQITSFDKSPSLILSATHQSASTGPYKPFSTFLHLNKKNYHTKIQSVSQSPEII
jgi:hypothetical protein